MLFNSPIFIFCFLPIVFVVYLILSKFENKTPAKTWLVLVSLFFYGYWKVEYLGLIILSILVNFLIGKQILNSCRNRKIYLILGVLFNVFLLGYFKYTNFIVDNFNSVVDLGFDTLDIILPLAISFFTFQQIAYLVDCYKEPDTQYNLLDYSLFITFFPQLIAGPIVHHKEMMPQFLGKKKHYFLKENFNKGVFIFCIGLFKKTVIADSFSVWADHGFNSTTSLNFIESWITSLSYTFQLYYDFSGYSDMAIGLALMFNIILPANFNSPYKAVNIQEFWRRWHMTLSRWLRDYIYIPLGGSKGSSRVLVFRNLFLVFLVGGIWHGAGWTFILWGCMHGIAVVTHRIWNILGGQMPRILGWCLTFVFINFSWVFFRANTVESALDISKSMLGIDNKIGILREGGWWQSIVNYLEILKISPDSQYLAISFIIVFGGISIYCKNSIEYALVYDNKVISNSWLKGLGAAFFFIFALIVSIGDTVQSTFLYFNF